MNDLLDDDLQRCCFTLTYSVVVYILDVDPEMVDVVRLPYNQHHENSRSKPRKSDGTNYRVVLHRQRQNEKPPPPANRTAR